MDRIEALQAWLARQPGLHPETLAPASSDASFRRYFRIATDQGSAIVMDAPPPQEDVRPFVAIAALLRRGGLAAPAVLAEDADQGFLLLDDLGQQTLADALAAGAPPDPLYRVALTDLVTLQQIPAGGQVPAYDRALLERELALFPDWYLDRHLARPLDAAGLRAWQVCTGRLVDACLAQPQVLVHRDYHCRNLMVLAQQPPRLGMLDFQDAVTGPCTYDLVSLLRDAYVEFPEDQQIDWLVRWWQQARTAGLPVPVDFGTLYRDFEWMGVQRHLKVLGIFARLWHRDGKDAYLPHLPRVLAYVQGTCERYDELRPLSRLLASQHDALAEGLSF